MCGKDRDKCAWRAAVASLGGVLIGGVYGWSVWRLGGSRWCVFAFPLGFMLLALLVHRGVLQKNALAMTSTAVCVFLMGWSIGNPGEGFTLMGAAVGWLLGYLPPLAVGSMIGLEASFSGGLVISQVLGTELVLGLLMCAVVFGGLWGHVGLAADSGAKVCAEEARSSRSTR